jgi:competence protein ComEA
MKYLKYGLSLILLLLLPFGAYATEEVESDKYEGIEITVNINTASSDELATSLLGVGQTKAEQIVAYREVHGNFNSADDLQLVKGIGQATVDKNRERIQL